MHILMKIWEYGGRKMEMIGKKFLTEDGGEKFTSGTWRYVVQIRIDGSDGLTYQLSNKPTVKVDGQTWTVKGNSTIGDLYSIAYAYGPEFTISEDSEPTKCTVSFNTNDGSIIADQIVNSGEKATRPSTNPTKTGYIFDDWYEDYTCTTKFDFNRVITADTVIYAKWNLKPHTHTLIKKDKIEPTCETDGTEEYWICYECGKMFSDESGTTEITTPATIAKLGHDWGDWIETTPATIDTEGTETRTCKNDITHTETKTIEKLALEIISGADASYTIESGLDVIVSCNGTYSNFKELQMDGIKIEDSNYKVKSGSTIATLKANYLDTLSVGNHILTFVYNDDRAVDATIKIAKADLPNNNNNDNEDNNNDNNGNNNTTTTDSTTSQGKGDVSESPRTGDNIIIYVALLLISSLGVLANVKFIKKN